MRSAIQPVISEARYEASARRVVTALERTGALQLALDRAIEYATAAQTSVEGLPESSYARCCLLFPPTSSSAIDNVHATLRFLPLALLGEGGDEG